LRGAACEKFCGEQNLFAGKSSTAHMLVLLNQSVFAYLLSPLGRELK